MTGGQNIVTGGAVPPYSTGRYDLNMNLSSSSGSDLWQKICLDTVMGSRNFCRNLAAAFCM